MGDLMGFPLRGRVQGAMSGAFDRTRPGGESGPSRPLKRVAPGMLWFGAAAGMWALGGVRGRRAAVRGAASLALASAAARALGELTVPRERPGAGGPATTPPARPSTNAFPGVTAVRAAAFTAGVALESPRWGAVVLPVAASVALSRIATGAPSPREVLVGAAVGVGAAFAVRGMVPSRTQLPAPARPRVDAPALPDGDGLIVVVNPSSGAQPHLMDPVRQLKTALPKAEVVLYEEDAGPLPDVLAAAAGDAAARGGVLGVCGGDGTVNAAVAPALEFNVPLMVLPGGTFNHFAADLGVETVADACTALAAGTAVRADVGRIKTLRRSDGSPASGADPAYFLNTFSIGVYPELVRLREHWSPRIGGPPATLLGVLHVLRTARPLKAAVNGKRHSMWLLFAGNGAYRSVGVAPVRRDDLADGLLDLRIAHGGRFARTRLLATALAGGFAKTRVYAAARPTRALISSLPQDAYMAYDGEVVPAPSALLLDKLTEALTVYRPVAD